MYTLSLEIINKCNLNCTYCYLGEKKNTYMSLETAQKAIDIAVHEANKQYDRTLMVYFIGGLATCYVTTDGGIYTCSELPEFKIGTVKAGLDVPRIREIVYLNDKVDSMCEGCEYIKHCKTRGCQTSNYEVNKDVYRPIEVNCKVTKWMYNLIKENLSEKQLNNMKAC